MSKAGRNSKLYDSSSKAKKRERFGSGSWLDRTQTSLFFFYPPLLWRCLISHFVLLIEHLAQAAQFDSRRTKHGRIQQNNNCEAARSDKIIQVSLNNTYFYTCPSQTVLVVDTLTLRYSQQLRQLFKQQNVLTSLSSLILLAKSSSFSVS